MNVRVLLSDQILDIEINPNTRIASIQEIIARQSLIPIETQFLYTLRENRKVLLEPSSTAYECDLVNDSEIIVEEELLPEESRESFVTRAVAACNANNLNALYSVFDDFGRSKSEALNIEDIINLINQPFENKWNCLHYACNAGYTDLAKELIELGANINMETTDNWTPLQLSCYNGHGELVKFLLSSPGIQVNQFTVDRGTALHVACSQQRLEIVVMLVENQADIFIEDSEGKVPSEMTDNIDICNYLATLSVESSAEKPPSFGGVVTYINPYQLADSTVFIILNTDKAVFCHYATREDYIQEKQPQYMIPIVHINSVNTVNENGNFCFVINGKLWSLKYFTPFNDMTETWKKMILDSIDYFQRSLNSRRKKGMSYEDLLGKRSLAEPRSSTMYKNTREEDQNVSAEDFCTVNVIKEGHFGAVSLAIKDNEHYNVKVFNKVNLDKVDMLKTAVMDSKKQKDLDHVFLQKLLWAFQSEKELFMVGEFVSRQTLADFLRSYGTFPEEIARFFCAQIVLVIEFLNSKGIIYRSLTSSKILIDDSGYIKLSMLSPSLSTAGTPFSSEVHQLGMLLYLMLTGTQTFYGIYSESGEMTLPGLFSDSAQSVISLMLKKETMLSEVKAHQFFSEVEWDQLLAKKVEPPTNTKN